VTIGRQSLFTELFCPLVESEGKWETVSRILQAWINRRRFREAAFYRTQKGRADFPCQLPPLQKGRADFGEGGSEVVVLFRGGQ